MEYTEEADSLRHEPEWELHFKGMETFTIIVLPESLYMEFANMLNYVGELELEKSDESHYRFMGTDCFYLFFNELNYYEQSFISISHYIEGYIPN